MDYESKRSQWALIVGLIILIITVLIALTANLKLEEAVEARKVSFQAQNLFDELDKKIKDWALLVSLSKNSINKSYSLEIAENELEIEEILTRIQSQAKKDLAQSESLLKTRKIWNNVRQKKNNFDSTDIDLIDKNLIELDLTEDAKVILHSATIIEYSKKLSLFGVVAVVIAIILIVFSFISNLRREKERARVILELSRLREEAESSSQLKSKFLSTVSHEIRTPLNGIIGLTDILLHTPPSDHQKMFINTIHQSGKTLLKIINDILDFSKIESGKFELENSDFSIIDVLDQVMFTLSPNASEKSIGLIYEMDPYLPVTVRGDSGRLSQVLFNLVGNAIKFTSFGSVTLKVQVNKVESTETVITFSVEDTGIGITDSELENLFIPFVQGKVTGTSGEAGTGLGLSISKQIVNAMGGKLQVSTELNRGTKFWFSIPFKSYSRAKIETHKQFRASKKIEVEQKIPIFNENYTPKILIVEDNPTNQIVAQSMLTELGTFSIIAANGREAIDFALKTEFDLILMDCQMPVMDGFIATKELRKAKVIVPIVAMTANASAEDEAKCLAAGMDDFLAKPISLQGLAEKLKKFLTISAEKPNRALIELEESIGSVGVTKVVSAFLSTVPEFYLKLNEFFDSDNLEGLKRLGHKYKSSSLIVGALPLANLCKKLEESDNIEVIKPLKDNLLLSMQKSEELLKFYINKHS